MPRYFTLDQAERLLPAVEAAIREAISRKRDFHDADSAIQKATQRIVSLGGSVADRGQFVADKARRETAARALSEAVEHILEFGCQAKDLDIGLIDFPTLYHDREVLLCWKLGESGIGFWHGLEDGFRGRKPIDDEFLANHRGDGLN